MEKPADNAYPINELIRQRWSPRAFEERRVEREKLLSLFEAARWAPSAFNAQPWSFIFATKEERHTYNRLLDCMPPSNQYWAQSAPVLVLTVTNLYLPSRKPDRFAYYDVGLAVENLVLQATALGLACHQTGGVDVKKARTEFSIPEGYDPIDVIAIGYAADASRLPEDLRVMELATRSRKPLRDFVFSDRWGQASPLLTE